MSTTLTTSLWDALRIWTVACPACDSATPTGHNGPFLQSKQKWFFSFLPVTCVVQCPKNSRIDSSSANHGGPSLCPNFPPITIVRALSLARPSNTTSTLQDLQTHRFRNPQFQMCQIPHQSRKKLWIFLARATRPTFNGDARSQSFKISSKRKSISIEKAVFRNFLHYAESHQNRRNNTNEGNEGADSWKYTHERRSAGVEQDDLGETNANRQKLLQQTWKSRAKHLRKN